MNRPNSSRRTCRSSTLSCRISSRRRAARRRLRQASDRHRDGDAKAGLQLVPRSSEGIQCYESSSRATAICLLPSLSANDGMDGSIKAMSRLTRRATSSRRLALPGRPPYRHQPEGRPLCQPVGEYDLQTFEWTDGVAKVMREVCMRRLPTSGSYSTALSTLCGSSR